MNYSTTSKSDLAIAYFPHLAPKSALNKLMSLIATDQVLYPQLLSTGYKHLQRHFTPLQLMLICDRFGRPY